MAVVKGGKFQLLFVFDISKLCLVHVCLSSTSGLCSIQDNSGFVAYVATFVRYAGDLSGICICPPPNPTLPHLVPTVEEPSHTKLMPSLSSFPQHEQGTSFNRRRCKSRQPSGGMALNRMRHSHCFQNWSRASVCLLSSSNRSGCQNRMSKTTRIWEVSFTT